MDSAHSSRPNGSQKSNYSTMHFDRVFVGGELQSYDLKTGQISPIYSVAPNEQRKRKEPAGQVVGHYDDPWAGQAPDVTPNVTPHEQANVTPITTDELSVVTTSAPDADIDPEFWDQFEPEPERSRTDGRNRMRELLGLD